MTSQNRKEASIYGKQKDIQLDGLHDLLSNEASKKVKK